MEKQARFEAFITEANVNRNFTKNEYPIFDALYGVHFSIWAYNKQEVADKVAKIISLATNTTVHYGPEPYLSSVLEWTFSTKEFECKFGIEKM